MEPNRRFACPLEAEWRLPRLAHAQPFLSAAVAHLKRSALSHASKYESFQISEG